MIQSRPMLTTKPSGLHMKRVNFNRSINFLLISISLIITGCTNAPKEPLSLDQADASKQSAKSGYDYQSSNALSKHKFKTASTHQGTVWERLLSLYSLPDVKHPRIDRAVTWYLEHPAALAILQQRAEPYLHHILDEVEANNIPGELALLPVVESAFVPNAYSKADASGLWQFVPATGKEFGLQQNDWYDGRRDVYASTKAAAIYLKQLNDNFSGDWLLALASYNCGQGRVKKSIEKNEDLSLATDFWSLDLPEETEDYVPRLLAIAKIFANADEYKIHLQHIPNRPYFEVVDIKSPLDLHKAAQLANTPLPKFLKLNPGFNRASTAPQGPHRLLVPVDQVQAFKENLATLPFSERVDLKQYDNERVANNRVQEKLTQVRNEVTKVPLQYTVKLGDNIASIATKNHIKSTLLVSANHLGKNPVHVGMKLLIPGQEKITSVAIVAATKTNINTNNIKTKAASAQVYAVKKGDTIQTIAKHFAVAPQELAGWNNFTLKASLTLGQKLTIKSVIPQFASVAPSLHLINYKVVESDTLVKIAKKFNVPLADLQKTNASNLVKGLHPGLKLKVLVDSIQTGLPT